MGLLHPRHYPAAIAYAVSAAALLVLTWLVPALGWVDPPEIDFGQSAAREATVRGVEVLGREPLGIGTVRTERVVLALDGAEIAIERQFLEDDPGGLPVEAGDRVLVVSAEGPAGTQYAITDRVRRVPLATLALIFAAVIVLAGGWRGARSLVGLGASALVIVRFVVPAVLAGHDPVAIAIAGSVVIMLATLTLTHGMHASTLIALAGTAIALAIAGAAAALSIDAAALTGLADEEAGTLVALTSGTIDPRGLLLAGIIIGALGVLDDVTVTQASTVAELRRAAPGLRLRELYERAMNVGREHVAATVNTLLLAYTGAALPLLALLAAQPDGLGALLSRDTLATEIVRTLAGSLGIVAAVPITTLLAAALAARGALDGPDEPAAPALVEFERPPRPPL